VSVLLWRVTPRSTMVADQLFVAATVPVEDARIAA
jgi:hypothetical protein